MSGVCFNGITCIDVYQTQVACISSRRRLDYGYINAIVFDVPNAFVPKCHAMRCNACGFANFARVRCELCIPRYNVRLRNTPIAINIFSFVGCTNGTGIWDTQHNIYIIPEEGKNAISIFAGIWNAVDENVATCGNKQVNIQPMTIGNIFRILWHYCAREII